MASSSLFETSGASADQERQNPCHVDSPPEASVGQAHAFAPLSALCSIARLHQIAADPATLVHQLGLSASEPLGMSDLLRAAQLLGLKARLTRTSVERLGLTPLPALALMRGEDDSLRLVILAQSDGRRVLLQDLTTGRPTIEPVELFAPNVSKPDGLYARLWRLQQGGEPSEETAAREAAEGVTA